MEGMEGEGKEGAAWRRVQSRKGWAAGTEGGEEKKEDKKTGTRAKSKCGGTAKGGCDSFAGRSLPRQQGWGEGMEAPSPLPVDQVCAKGVCVSV